MTLNIFRHGETYQSKFNVVYGAEELTAEVLPEAVPTVERIGEYLKSVPTEANFTSEYLRCRQTAEIIESVSGKKFQSTPLLNEFVAGQFSDLQDRGLKFLEMVEDKRFDQVVVCTHGAVMACLKHLVMEGDFLERDLFDYPATGVVWEISKEGLTEKNFRGLGS